MHRTAQDIVQQNRMNECVILITWEVSIEQAMAYWLAVESGISATDMMRGNIGVEWEKFDAAIAKVSSAPVYIIGHSIGRDTDKKRRRPHLPPSVINLALDYIMNDMGLEPRMITMDYLQRIHTERSQRVDRNEHYLQCVDWAKDTAIWSGSAVYLGTQARREVDDQAIKIPSLRDSQWSSNAEQSADKFLSLWMPKQSHYAGDTIDLGGELGEIEVSDNLLLLAASKQKFGPAGKVFPLIVDPEHLEMKDAYKPGIQSGRGYTNGTSRRKQSDR
jgi:replicative DNA helicase